jgi:rsbT antagonist protein RsbS
VQNDVPLLKNKDIMVVPLPGRFNDSTLRQIEADLLERSAGNNDLTGVILDVSGFECIDLFSARMLFNLTKKLALMDLDSVLVGLKPELALTLVEMGLTTLNIETALCLEHGLQKLKQRKRK